MAFQRRIALKGGDTSSIEDTFTSNTLIGNLWTYYGSPAGDQIVDITVDGCDIGDVYITSDWGIGSEFTFTCINGGRILGLGGDGGRGGNDYGATGEAGDDGDAGQHAIRSVGFDVNVDIDDGYLLGGGGGGGGGSYQRRSATIGDPGGGGGGGAGFSVTNGGNAGFPTGLPQASDGLDGGPTGPGAGGIGGIFDSSGDGGSGGNWGSAGDPGNSSDAFSSGFLGPYNGGIGGNAGKAFHPTSGASINFIGSKNETTLRGELRLMGQITALVPVMNKIRNHIASQAGTSEHGWSFQSDGILHLVNSISGGNDINGHWYPTSPASNPGIGNLYEVRNRDGTDSQDTFGWDTTPGTQGDWFDLNFTRLWSITSSSGIRTAGALLQFRAKNQPTGDILCSGFFLIGDENGL